MLNYRQCTAGRARPFWNFSGEKLSEDGKTGKDRKTATILLNRYLQTRIRFVFNISCLDVHTNHTRLPAFNNFRHLPPQVFVVTSALRGVIAFLCALVVRERPVFCAEFQRLG